MAWIEDIKQDFVITTGDGKKYKPNWLNANRSIEYNISVFNFKGVKGSLVDRREPVGRIYDVEIYFQGANNLATASNFLDSAENKKAWTIFHPLYGSLYVQPMFLRVDDRSFNASKVTGQLMQTFGTPLVNPNISPVDLIQAKKLDTDITMSQAYAVNIPEALASDVAQMKVNNQTIERLSLAFSSATENAQAVVNAYNRANAKIDNAFSDAFGAVRAIQDVINLPATFSQSIFNRVNFLLGESIGLYGAITSITTPRLKRLYEHNVGTIITAMCLASVTNVQPNDYQNRRSVIQVVDLILTGYNNYIDNLCTLQTDRADRPDSYTPDFDGLNGLCTLVKYTLSNLFDIASNAKQQRVYVLPTDSNLVLLAYKLLGLQSDDSTIKQLQNDNGIGLNEILQIKKGREIIYYV